jgi:hypothetical protein
LRAMTNSSPPLFDLKQRHPFRAAGFSLSLMCHALSSALNNALSHFSLGGPGALHDPCAAEQSKACCRLAAYGG